MTKEEVAEVVAYCEANKISYKQRLKELGVSARSFYDAKLFGKAIFTPALWNFMEFHKAQCSGVRK